MKVRYYVELIAIKTLIQFVKVNSEILVLF